MQQQQHSLLTSNEWSFHAAKSPYKFPSNKLKNNRDLSFVVVCVDDFRIEISNFNENVSCSAILSLFSKIIVAHKKLVSKEIQLCNSIFSGSEFFYVALLFVK